MTDKYGIPNPCTSCHKDKTTRWALDALNRVVQRLAVEDGRAMTRRTRAEDRHEFRSRLGAERPSACRAFPDRAAVHRGAVDLRGWALGATDPPRFAATALYVLGTLGAVAAYFTGRAASKTVWLPGMAHAVGEGALGLGVSHCLVLHF